MLKLLKNVLAFALFFAAFYFVLLLIIALSTTFTYKAENFMYKYSRISENELRKITEFYDWLEEEDSTEKGIILGSSTAYKNIDPAILTQKTGIDFFNCGTDAQHIAFSEKILRYVTEDHKINYLLLDVVPVLWENDSQESAIKWAAHNSYPYKSFKMVAAENNITLWYYYFYFLMKRMIPSAKYAMEAPLPNWVYKGKGHLCIDNATNINYVNPEKYNKISTANIRALNRIAGICRDRNIKLIVSIPKVLNGDIDEKLVEVEGACFINAEDYSIDSFYLRDSHHMSCNGAARYSQWLGDQLSNCLAENN